MLRHVPHLIWGVVLWSATPAPAQNSALGELYGQGVHAYNSGNYVEAHNLLTRAIDSGSQDPRCRYFRGLSYIRLGRSPEARADFAAGAELEMADTDRFYAVSKSLERIQGRSRTLLEQYRSNARLRAFEARENRNFNRYQRIRRNQANVTIQRGGAEEVPGVEPDETKPAVEAPPEETPPEEMPADEAPVDEMPAEEPTPDAEDPFGENAKPEEMPAEEAAPDDGQPKNDEDDPFAEDAKPDDAMPADDAPAEDGAADGDQPKSDEDDPFADDAKPQDEGAKPDEEMPADEAPAEDGAAGGDKSKSDDDDPFGDDAK